MKRIMKKHFDDLEIYLQLVLKEGRKLAKRKRTPKDWCSPKCASCLAAEARTNVDLRKYGLGFDEREDVCMLEARDILAEELNWEIN